MNNSSGKLYIVSTPIGNLSDMTFRAIEVLKTVDLIAAEDTRHTKELLNHFDIKTKTTSYHEHNKYEKADELIEELLRGLSIAVVTDAGTPIISDPGEVLVRKAIENDILVTSVPGACAAINALVLSGLDASQFIFIGFISDDNKKRKILQQELKNETRTMIFYISPHSILKDFDFFIETFGKDRKASLSREMTKKYEETIRGDLVEIKEKLISKDIKGEFVLVINGLDKRVLERQKCEMWQNMSINDHMKIYLDKGFTEKEAMKEVARDRNIDKREIYRELKIKV